MAAETPSASVRALPILRLDQLWAIVALALIAGFISLVPTSPNDFWWHLKAGALIADGGIPATNLFAWTLPADHPYIYQSWLGELLFYRIYELGGLPLVIFTRNLLGTLAFALVALAAHDRTGSWRLAALATLLAAAMTINNLNTRPQNWSWVPFAGLFFLLSRYGEGRLGPRWLIALPLIMIFWVNAHGAFMMGLLVAGAFAVGETLRRLLRQPRALSWDRLRALYLACAAMGAAVLVNPLGLGVISYVRTLLSDAPSQRLINEWQTPDPRLLAGALFYLGVLAVIAAFAFARRRPTITEVILVCGLAWQAFIGVRYVVWFGMVAMPIAAQCLVAARPIFTLDGPARPSISARERGGGAVANLALALVLLIGVGMLQPWIKPLLPLPQPYQALFAPVPGAPQSFGAATPVAAVEHLRARPCAGPLFNELGYGSYLAWALYPVSQSFIDPRVELYPMELWDEYLALNSGQDVAERLDRLGVACVLLDVPLQPNLAAAMAALPGWARSFTDGRSEVWRRS